MRRGSLMREAASRKALAEARVASTCLARQRLRPIQAKTRSTTQRRVSGEADLCLRLAHELDVDGGCLGNAVRV